MVTLRMQDQEVTERKMETEGMWRLRVKNRSPGLWDYFGRLPPTAVSKQGAGGEGWAYVASC